MENEYDKSNLRRVILTEPDQFADGFAAVDATDINPIDYRALDKIMISGMGGSALPANVLRIYLGSLFDKGDHGSEPIGIYQNRYYTLPREAYDKCLNLICSHSGNTE